MGNLLSFFSNKRRQLQCVAIEASTHSMTRMNKSLAGKQIQKKASLSVTVYYLISVGVIS